MVPERVRRAALGVLLDTIEGAENGLGDIKQVLGSHEGATYVLTVTADSAGAAAGYFDEISSTWQWA